MRDRSDVLDKVCLVLLELRELNVCEVCANRSASLGMARVASRTEWGSAIVSL